MNQLRDLRQFSKSLNVSMTTFDDFVSKYPRMYLNPMILEERNLNVTSLDIFSRLLMDRILFLGSEINSDVANILTAQMLWLSQQGSSDIQLYVNSPGGSVYDGMQIIDTMNFVDCDIATTCLGCAASMGAVIFSNGTKGKRSIIEHGRFMIHQPIGGTGHSQASDIEIISKQINKLKMELYEILSNNSNLSIEEIEKKSDRDCWMTSKECLDMGFADKIISKNG